MKNKERKIAYIEWEDSATYWGWTREDEVVRDEDLRHCSIGAIIAETRKSITISTVIKAGLGKFADPMTIPKSNISKIKRLSLGKILK